MDHRHKFSDKNMYILRTAMIDECEEMRQSYLHVCYCRRRCRLAGLIPVLVRHPFPVSSSARRLFCRLYAMRDDARKQLIDGLEHHSPRSHSL